MKLKNIQILKEDSPQFTGERFVFHESLLVEMTCEHLHRYMFATLLVEGKKVLDIASGEGYGSFMLSQVAADVTGVDIDPSTVKSASEKYVSSNLHFAEGNCTSIPFESGTFDAVVSFETIEHIAESEVFIAEVKRVLRKGGLFICSSPNREEYRKSNPSNEYHLRELSQEEFAQMVGGVFNKTRLLGQSFLFGSSMNVVEDEYKLAMVHFKDMGTQGVDAHTCLPDSEYTVLLASDSDLPEIKDSFFEGDYPRNYISALLGGIEERDAAFKQEQTRLEVELMERDAALIAEQSRLEAELAERDAALVAEQSRLEMELVERDAALVAEQSRLEAELAERDAALVAEQVRLEAEIRKRDSALVAEQARLGKELEKRDVALVAEQQRLEAELADFHAKFLEERLRLEKELVDREATFSMVQADLKTANSELANATKERDRYKLYFKQQVEYTEMLKQSLSFLRHMLATMAGDVAHVQQSLRWKIGTGIIRFLDAFQFKFKSPSRLDRMDRTVADFRQWESGFDQCERKSETLNACDIQYFDLWDRAVVSVIIPVYNQYEFTRTCINSIVKSGAKVPYEIIVADDLSTDDTTQIKEEFPFVKVVRNETNLGFLKNCNKAAATAEGDYLLLLNNDTQVQKGWLEALFNTLEGDLSIAVCGSKLVYPDGTLQEAGGILWEDGSAWNYGRGGDPNASQFNYVKEVDYISGASIMVRRSFWDEVGGFDERYAPAYCEDSDLAFEARKRGYKVVYQPKSVVVHFEGKSHGTDEASGLKAYQVANGKKLFEKWKGVFEKEHLPNGQDPVAARDRSIGKKRVLYVDHYVPHFDQDAGSKTALHYLRLLRENDVAVTFLGDNFARLEPYTEVLQQMGIEVLYGVDWYENWEQWFGENSHLFTHVFLNRPHIAQKYIEIIRKNSDCKILYYGHDLHFLREQRRAERAGESLNNKDIQKIKLMELSTCSQVDVCYYPSEVEVGVVHKELPDAVVKAVPAYIYDTPSDDGKPMQDRKGILFVGGFGHPPNIQAVEHFLENIYPAIEASDEDIPFFIVGSRAPVWLNELDRPNVYVKGFVSELELQNLYASCRLVVAPLLYGAGVKGKVVEALHYGVPVISTSVGAEGLCETDAVVVVDDDAEYAKAVVDFHTDVQRLERLSESAKEFVQQFFTTKAAVRIIGEDFNIED